LIYLYFDIVALVFNQYFTLKKVILPGSAVKSMIFYNKQCPWSIPLRSRELATENISVGAAHNGVSDAPMTIRLVIPPHAIIHEAVVLDKAAVTTAKSEFSPTLIGCA
jgi:hypothetical protein